MKSRENKVEKDPKVEVKRAEREVARSASEFETAMEHLGGTVEDKVEKVREVGYRLQAPKRAWLRTKENPAPVAIGAGVVLAALIGASYGRRWGFFRRSWRLRIS